MEGSQLNTVSVQPNVTINHERDLNLVFKDGYKNIIDRRLNQSIGDGVVAPHLLTIYEK
jgi:hypothetical protein